MSTELAFLKLLEKNNINLYAIDKNEMNYKMKDISPIFNYDSNYISIVSDIEKVDTVDISDIQLDNSDILLLNFNENLLNSNNMIITGVENYNIYLKQFGKSSFDFDGSSYFQLPNNILEDIITFSYWIHQDSIGMLLSTDIIDDEQNTPGCFVIEHNKITLYTDNDYISQDISLDLIWNQIQCTIDHINGNMFIRVNGNNFSTTFTPFGTFTNFQGLIGKVPDSYIDTSATPIIGNIDQFRIIKGYIKDIYKITLDEEVYIES